MAEQIRTELVVDPSKFTAPMQEAAKEAQKFSDHMERVGAKAPPAADKTAKGATDAMRAVEGLARESKGLANDIADMAKGGDDFARGMTNLSFSAGRFGGALKDITKDAGGLASKLGGFLGSAGIYGSMAAGALQAGLAIRDMIRPEVKKGWEDTAKIMKEIAAMGPAIATTFKTREQAFDDFGDVEKPGDVPAWAASKRGPGRREPARQRAEAQGERDDQQEAAFRERVTQQMGREADLIAQMRALDDRAAADKAALTAEQDAELYESKKQAALDYAIWQDQLRLKDEALNAQLQAADEAEMQRHLDAYRAMFADFYAAFPGGALASILYPPGKGAQDMVADSEAIAVATSAMAATMGAAVQGASQAVGMAYDRMLGASVKYTYANKEQAKAQKAMELTTGQAMRVIVRDVLKSTAVQATVRALFETAEGIAATFTNPPLASTKFAAAAAFAATAALAGAAAAAVGTVNKTVPGGGRGGGGGGDTGGGVGRGAREGRAGNEPTVTNITVQVMPGTDATRIGEAMERAINSARRERGKTELN